MTASAVQPLLIRRLRLLIHKLALCIARRFATTAALVLGFGEVLSYEPIYLRMAASAENLSLVRHLVGDHLAFSGADGRTDDVQLAVHEAVSNVVRHAYDDEAGEFGVEVRLDDDGIGVVVRDEGCGPSPRVPRREGFGMGIPIMETLADSFSIEGNASTGTEVRMRFLH